MPQPKRGLGKGLGALIPTGPPAPVSLSGGQVPGLGLAMGDEELAGRISGAYLEELPVGSIVPNPRQPRQVFDEDALSELAVSIEAVGLLQPVVVRRTAGGQYELIMCCPEVVE